MKIKELRISLSMPQWRLSKMTGISLPQLHRLEVGACYPRADKLPTLAKALGCRIDDLFTEEELDAKAPADDTPPWEEDDDSLDGLLE